MKEAYEVNEVFYSLQGEGIRAGTPNVFVRFAGCNLHCTKESIGFDCDTEFESAALMSLAELMRFIYGVGGQTCKSVVLTGGEPMLQVDIPLLEALHGEGYYIQLETNGTRRVPEIVDWITISPKVAEHALAPQGRVDELKYVRFVGQAIPQPSLKASFFYVSPAFEGLLITEETLQWCIDLVKQNPGWRLSIQQHKVWGIR